METIRLIPRCLSSLATLVALSWSLEVSAAIVNIDFQGVRNVPGPDVPGPVFSGLGAAGGGTVWNGLDADSRLPDGNDEDNLTVSGKNLVDDAGLTTGLGFTVGPVGGDVCCAAPVVDPQDPLALFNEYIFNNSAGNSAGESPFTITGLGGNATVDLYFYKRSGSVTIEGAVLSDFFGEAPFAAENTFYFKDVPVNAGTVTGSMGGGTAVLYGLSISAAEPFGTPAAPVVESTSPSGRVVRTNAVIAVQLRDKATAVVPSSIRLFLNGQAVSPQITRDAGTGLTTVTYDPQGTLQPEATQVVRIVFGSDAVPPIVQTNEFSFFVISDQRAGLVINIDFNGARNDPGPDELGPTYSGPSAAGGGAVWNGIAVDSRLGDGTDNDNLDITGSALLDSLGGTTSIGFAANAVAGDVGGAPTTDPTAGAALFADYLFNNSAGNAAGQSPFVISGLGQVPVVDLYFYRAAGTVALADVTPSAATPIGIFTAGNTTYFKNVPVLGGSVSGNFGPGTTVINGLSILKPLPQPIVKSVAPTGQGILGNAIIRIELLDYVTQVDPLSIKLSLNGQIVVPTVTKPAGSDITTVSYDPPGSLPGDSVNLVEITFSDRSSPPVAQAHSFSFTVFNEVKAATIVNVDFNGARSGDELGPTFSGVGPAGGGTVWNGITADSRLEGGGDDDNLTVGGTDLLDSMGGSTPIAFTVGPVGGDVGGAPTTNPTASQALFSDYVFNNSAGNTAGQSPFVITGLGEAPTVDLYFYRAAGTVSVPDAASSAVTPSGLFNGVNTTYFKSVPVLGGSVSGNFGPGVTVINGLSIVKPLPQPIVKSVAPTGEGVPGDAIVRIELQDYVTQVDPGSIRLLFNGLAVTPIVTKPAGSSITTVTYDPPGDLPGDSVNLVQITFGDNATPPVVQVRSFSFSVFSELKAATIVNIDFNGVRNVPGPDELGPTYSGTGAAGGGAVWNGITADSRLEGGADDDNLTVTATDLLNSLGVATTIAFSVAPMGGDVGGAPTTDPTAREALFSDYIFNLSAGNTTAESPFTISGLGNVPFVDLYFYRSNGGLSVGAEPRANFVSHGIFTTANTYYYRRVPVTNGQVDGLFGPGTAVVNGMTIVIPGALGVTRQGSDILISWSGSATLQSAPEVTGTWSDVPNATNPLTVTPTEAHRFYRLRF